MTELYKIMRCMGKVDREKISPLSKHKTRGKPMKLNVRRSRTDKRKYFLIQCIAKLWNLLPQEIVGS